MSLRLLSSSRRDTKAFAGRCRGPLAQRGSGIRLAAGPAAAPAPWQMLLFLLRHPKESTELTKRVQWGFCGGGSGVFLAIFFLKSCLFKLLDMMSKKVMWIEK